MKASRQIVAALSEDSMGGIATLADVDHAEQLVDAHRAEVIAEDELLPKADVVAWLTKRAREFRAHGDPAGANTAAILASKVARGAVRPNNLRMLPANSFEPDRTYAYGSWQFRCERITTHPDGGVPVAIGWMRGEGTPWGPYAYELAQWSADWADVTEAGAR